MPVSNECSVCGNNRKTTLCRCPWDKPFSSWTPKALGKVKAMVADADPDRDWREG